MTVRRVAGWSIVLLVLAASAASAQEIKIRVAQPGADRLMSDLKDIVDLTPNKALQKEWKNIGDTLESFLGGIDREKPVRVEFKIAKDDAGKGSLTYEPSFPIAKFSGKKGDSFLENVDSFGYKVKELKGGIYEITEPNNKTAKPMYMRHLQGYAIIAGSQQALPANLPNPADDVQALLKGGYDVAVEMKHEAAGMAGRKAEFESLRKELEAAIKFKRGEDETEFELRKLGAAQSFDEAQRFLVEAETLMIGWTTAPKAKTGDGVLTLTALPQTSLLDSIRLLSTKPSYFANVKLHGNEVLSGKWLFPLDQFRQDHAKVRHPVFRAATKAAMDRRPLLNDEGKAAAKEAIDKLVDIFDASLDIGFDGFIDMHSDDNGKNTAVIGMRCEKSKNADDIVALMPKIRNDWAVKMNAVEHGGVTIHELTVPQRRLPEFESLFAGAPMFYIGTNEKAVWFAAGKNGLDELKQAIDDQAKPLPEAPDPVFTSVTMKFGPFLTLLDVIRAQEPKDNKEKTKQEIQQEKERDRTRQIALEAFAAGDDRLTAKLSRDGDTVKGEITINEGIFRFIGSAIADFSKTNLR